MDYPNDRPIEPQDFIVVQSVVELIKGDGNRDGAVNAADLQIVMNNYGTNTTNLAAWGIGDFNADGLVNVGDLGILGLHYGSGVTSPAGVAIPEPSTACFLAFGAIGLLRRRRRK